MSAVEALSPRRQSAPVLQRVAFRTSRVAEFCSINELAKRTGRPTDEWPLIVLKETVDNGLDACEEPEIAPIIDIAVSTATGEIVITDNGPGILGETLASLIDYNSRTSSREAYVAPSRGQQGNAMQSIFAMAYALDGTRGETVIESRGQAHTITFETDRILREPRITHEVAASNTQIGSRVTVRWPQKA